MKISHNSGSDCGSHRPGVRTASLTNRRRAVLFLLPVVIVIGLNSPGVFGGQSSGSLEPEVVLATFEGGEITVKEFRDAMTAEAKELGGDFDPMTHGRALLEYLATQEILELEALAMGYADEHGVRDPEIIEAKEKVMKNTLRREVILAGVDVSEDEIKELYERGKKRRLTRAIVLGNKEDAERVGRELAAGADFVEMAEKWSLELGSASWKGILGWVKPGDGPEDVEDLIYELPVGEVGGPVHSALGYYFVKVDSVGEMPEEPYEEQRDYYRSVVRKRKYSPVYTAYMDSVARALDVEYDEGTIELIADRFAGEGWIEDDRPGRASRIPAFSPEEYAMPVFTFKGGSRTLDEYLEYIRTRVGNSALYLAGPEEVERGLRLFLHETLALRLAYEMGMDKVRGVRGHVRQRAFEKGKVDMLVEAAGGEEANRPTEEGRSEYYENNPHLYMQPGAVVVSIINILEEDAVHDLYLDAKEGVPFEQLESDFRWILDKDKTTQRLRLESGDGSSAFTEEDESVLLNVTRRMELGAVSEPIPMPGGGYAVVKLLEREEGKLLPYEEVRDEVSTDYNMQILTGATKKIEDFKESLREKYNYRVNEDALEAMKH